MGKLKVALLTGGASAEREVSLASGKEVIKALKKLGHEVFVYDTKSDLGKLFKDRKKLDVAIPVLHGPGGEDGTIQGFLEAIGLPYAFSGVLASALGMDKWRQRIIFRSCGLNVPPTQVLTSEKTKIRFKLPVVVKPNFQGSSVGVAICENKKELRQALKEAFRHDEIVLVEKYIKGREITAGALGKGAETKALPVVEIRPKRKFFDYQAKYNGSTEEIVPAPLPRNLYRQAQKVAVKTHQALGCSGVTRTDMILKGNTIYVLEINTIPGLTRESLVPKMTKAEGMSFEELVQELINLALS